MPEIKFETGAGDPDAFNLYENGKKIGEMIIEIKDGKLTVYHTEVDVDHENKGYAGQLLERMVAYARQHEYKVVPLCQYVRAQFERNREQYADLWNDHHTN